MAASDITVSGLTATSGRGIVVLNWSVSDRHSPSGRPYLQLDRVEIWASNTNDRATATKIAESISNASEPVFGSINRYYWARARNTSGLYGDWHPASATDGVHIAVQVGQAAPWLTAPYQFFDDGNVVIYFGECSDPVPANSTRTENLPIEIPTTLWAHAFPTSTPGNTELFQAHVVSYTSTSITVGARRVSNGGTVDRPQMNVGF
jgi:hypothetical protein